MKYKIIPGIAALVHVECELFPMNYGRERTSFIFLADGKPVEKGVGDPVEFNDLPLKVRAEINKHFGTVFALPIEARGRYLKDIVPWEVEA